MTEMPEPYSYLVCYCVHGEEKTFWALDVQHGDDGVYLDGYKGQRLFLTYSTSMCIKEKDRPQTPNYVIGRVEDLDPSEVAKLEDSEDQYA